MTKFEIISIIISIVLGALSTGIPSIIAFIKSIKKTKAAKSEAERLAAIDDMKKNMITFAQAAEIAYKEINAVLKSQGSSAGPAKHDSVMIKLQNYAAEKGYAFDAEYWNQEIKSYVDSTKTINV